MSKLNPDELTVDTFATTGDQQTTDTIVLTVWIYYETYQYESCGGTCLSCPVCYA